jgi:precorrin-2 methylase
MCKEKAILHRIDEDVPYEGRSLNCLETSDIILIHDHEKTTRLFYKIIDRYLENKFEFLTL